MKTIIEYGCLGIFSLIFTLICVPLIRKIAMKVNLVDKPNYRKVHFEPTPLIGGIAIAFVFFLTLTVTTFDSTGIKDYLPILGASFILLTVGVVDDKNDLKAKYKLLIQLLLSFFIAFSGTRISSFYGLLGVWEIAVWLQYVLTIVVITGVVNAFNLMDGVDGLVGGLSFLGFSILLMASWFYNDPLLGKQSVIFMGAIIGFLKFNFSKNKIFMGDSGSLFLGFILVSSGIYFLEKQSANANQNHLSLFLLLVAFFTIPVLDSIRVYLGRIKEGYSPFKADKSHLHHLLLQVGLPHKKIALFVTLWAIFLSFIGLSLTSFFSITSTILLIIAVFWTIIKVLLMINDLYKWRKMIQVMETY